MQRIALLLLALFPALLAAQPNSPLKGMIKVYPGGLPMQGVNVIAKPGGSDVTETDGSFALLVPGKVPGDKVYLTPIKNGYRPARSETPMVVYLRSDPEEWVIIELCQNGNCPEDELYRKFQQGFEQKIESINLEISKLPENSARVVLLQDSIATLYRQQEERDGLIRELSKQIVRTDFANASPITRQGLSYLEAGKSDSAILLFEQARVRQALHAIVKEEDKARALVDSLCRKKQDYITATLTLARAYAGEYELDSAILAYREAIAADTSDLENRYDFAVFLSDIKRYDEALAMFEALLTRELEPWRRGFVFRYMGNIFTDIGKLEQAFQAYIIFKNTYVALAADDSVGSLKEGLAISYAKLGDTYASMGALDTALKYYEKFHKLIEELYLVNPQNESLKSRLAISYERLGIIYSAQGDLNTALRYYQDETVLFKELYRSNPRSESLKNGLAIAYSKLGDTYATQGVWVTALQYYEQSNNLTKELYFANSRSESLKNGLAISYERLGTTYAALGALDTALRYYRHCNTLSEELYNANPRSELLKNGLAISCEKLGTTYAKLGALDTALQYYQKDLKLTKELYCANPQNESLKNGLAISYLMLGEISAESGTLDTALRYFEQHNKLTEELYQANPRSESLKISLAISYLKLGNTYAELDDWETALRYHTQSSKLAKELYRANPRSELLRDYLEFRFELLRMQSLKIEMRKEIHKGEPQYWQMYQAPPAEKVKRAEAEIAALKKGKDALALAQKYGGLSWYLLFDHRPKQAEEAAREGLRLGEAYPPKETLWINTNLALALLYQGNYDEAVVIYKRFRGKRFPDDDKRTWNEVFLADLDELEAAGITHPDVEKIRKLLEK
jgi:tetratricopeptide (TPR) repeat protein